MSPLSTGKISITAPKSDTGIEGVSLVLLLKIRPTCLVSNHSATEATPETTGIVRFSDN